MNWNKGFTAEYYAYYIDPVTFRETEKLNIISGSISKTLTGLRNACDLTISGHIEAERWIRVYLDASQAGASAHIPLFTGLTSNPEREIDGNIEENTLQCFSVLKPCEDVLLNRGYYVPAGVTGDLILKDLLSITPAEVQIADAAPALRKAIIAEDGETHLSMADKVLNALNWRIRLQGDGTIELAPMPIEAIAEFDPLENDIVEPSIDISFDWYECPNVFRAIQGQDSATAKDEDPDSPFSIVNRGREVWKEDTSVKLNTGESIGEYALRRLKEEQRVSLSASYSRRFKPEILPSDLVISRYNQLQGMFKVISQNIDIGYGATTEEEVESYE